MWSSSSRGVIESVAARNVIARLREGGDTRDREAKRRIAEREASAGGQRLGVVERAELCREAPIAVTEEVARRGAAGTRPRLTVARSPDRPAALTAARFVS